MTSPQYSLSIVPVYNLDGFNEYQMGYTLLDTKLL